MFEKVLDFLLKNNDDSNQDDGKECLKDSRQVQVEDLCQQVRTSDNEHSNQDESRPRLLEPDKDRVDEKRHERNVQDIGDSDILQDVDQVHFEVRVLCSEGYRRIGFSRAWYVLYNTIPAEIQGRSAAHAHSDMARYGIQKMKILITGAAGNLGSFLAKYLLGAPHELRLMIHRRELSYDVAGFPNARVYRADLGEARSLDEPCKDVNCIVHYESITDCANWMGCLKLRRGPTMIGARKPLE